MVLPLLLMASLQGDGAALEPTLAQDTIDHAPLFGGWGSYVRLPDERERWAIATVESVGAESRWSRATSPDGAAGATGPVFDVGLRVLDGWNVARGPLAAFWEQDARRLRRRTLERMVGTRVLVRLAPTEGGHSVWISGTDAAPTLSPAYAIRPDRPYVDRLLPTGEATLPKGSADARRWYALWAAATRLSPSAYEPFAMAVSVATMPETPEYESTPSTGDGRPGRTDVRWLQGEAGRQNPEFGLMVADYLGRREIAGAQGTMRALVRRALDHPEVYPDGLFRVADPRFLRSRFDPRDPEWPPVGAIAGVLPGLRNPWLTVDLLGLLTGDREIVPPDRARLLPLLASSDLRVRRAAEAAFATWQGTPPKGTDPVVWHTARARLGVKELEAAKAVTAG